MENLIKVQFLFKVSTLLSGFNLHADLFFFLCFPPIKHQKNQVKSKWREKVLHFLHLKAGSVSCEWQLFFVERNQGLEIVRDWKHSSHLSCWTNYINFWYSTQKNTYIYIYIYIRVCACVCEREIDRDRHTDRDRRTERYGDHIENQIDMFHRTCHNSSNLIIQQKSQKWRNVFILNSYFISIGKHVFWIFPYSLHFSFSTVF